MGNTYTNVLLHVVFSTKRREPMISSALEPGLHAYLGGVIRNHRGHALAIGGTYDHVHVLGAFPAAMSLSEMVRHMKGGSSFWINERNAVTGHFEWQAGYSAFSVSEDAKHAVAAYVRNQKAHHRTLTFREEYVDLLKRHGIEYDERYLWD